MAAPGFLSAEEWAAEQFGQVDVGDVRRTRRAVKVAARMAHHPAGSIPAQSGDWASTKGAYRLFDQEAVTFEAVVSGHWARTRQAAGKVPLVLMVQDNTQLDFTHLRAVEGLGPIGDGKGRGLWLQTILAVEPSAGRGSVLGVAQQAVFCGRRVPAGETATQRQSRQRKGRAWLDAVEAVGSSPSSSRWIHVADREADSFGFFVTCRQTATGFLVRLAQDRRAALGQEAERPAGYAKQLARSLAPLGGKRLFVRRRPKRQPRWAHLLVSAGAATVFAPWLGDRGAAPVRGWLVRVWEVDGPTDEEPIEWILLSSEPVEDLAAAVRVASWYSLRWLIEDYHKCLKTGCRVESRQLKHVRRLKPLVGMCAVVAVRLLQLKEQAEGDPEGPAKRWVSVGHVAMLAAYFKQSAADMTIRQFWRGVARLGGFLGRRGDGQPGWQTLWRGWQKLDLMTLGASLRPDPGG